MPDRKLFLVQSCYSPDTMDPLGHDFVAEDHALFLGTDEELAGYVSALNALLIANEVDALMKVVESTSNRIDELRNRIAVLAGLPSETLYDLGFSNEAEATSNLIALHVNTVERTLRQIERIKSSDPLEWTGNGSYSTFYRAVPASEAFEGRINFDPSKLEPLQ
jgi:hypothetical protein